MTDADRVALEQVHREGPTHRQRQRAQAVLPSVRGYTFEQLADLFQTHRDTVSGWRDAWQERGLAGSEDAPKPGRTPKIDAAIKTYLHEMAKKAVQITWGRIRRVPPKSPPEQEQTRIKR